MMKKGKKRTYLFFIAGIIIVVVIAVSVALMNRPVSLSDLLDGDMYQIMAISSTAGIDPDGVEEAELLGYLAEYRMRRVWLTDQTYSVPPDEELYNVMIRDEDGDGAYVKVFLCAGKKTRFDLNLGAKGGVRVYEAISGEENTPLLLKMLQTMIG